MHPRIAAMSGTLRGQVFPLGDEPVTIGRETSNRIALNDRAVSRRHCVIRPEEGRFRLQDLESHNGTFINGIPTGDHLLENGDELRVGESLFLIQLEETDEAAPRSVVEL